MLRNPNHVSEAISVGIPAQLGELSADLNAIVREKATEGLCHFAGHAIGRTAIVNGGLVEVVAKQVRCLIIHRHLMCVCVCDVYMRSVDINSH